MVGGVCLCRVGGPKKERKKDPTGPYPAAYPEKAVRFATAQPCFHRDLRPAEGSRWPADERQPPPHYSYPFALLFARGGRLEAQVVAKRMVGGVKRTSSTGAILSRTNSVGWQCRPQLNRAA